MEQIRYKGYRAIKFMKLPTSALLIFPNNKSRSLELIMDLTKIVGCFLVYIVVEPIGEQQVGVAAPPD